MDTAQREEIDRLWQRKVSQDAQGLSIAERHRNLAPASAEFLYCLAAGLGCKKLLEIGGSSGISTIALASAAAANQGKLISLEIEPARQAEAKATIGRLKLSASVEFHLGDAARVLPSLDELDFALLDCEKEDYIRFFDMLRMREGGIVAADNVLSHNLRQYVSYVRSFPNMESITLPIGQGLEITRIVHCA